MPRYRPTRQSILRQSKLRGNSSSKIQHYRALCYIPSGCHRVNDDGGELSFAGMYQTLQNL